MTDRCFPIESVTEIYEPGYDRSVSTCKMRQTPIHPLKRSSSRLLEPLFQLIIREKRDDGLAIGCQVGIGAGEQLGQQVIHLFG